MRIKNQICLGMFVLSCVWMVRTESTKEPKKEDEAANGTGRIEKVLASESGVDESAEQEMTSQPLGMVQELEAYDAFFLQGVTQTDYNLWSSAQELPRVNVQRPSTQSGFIFIGNNR